MTDEDETAEPVPGKISKRDRLKGALNRTKTKLRKRDTTAGTALEDDEVEDFLAAGRNSTSTGRPSISDSLRFADSIPPRSEAGSVHTRPSTGHSDSSASNIRSTLVPVPDPFVPPPQQSPRRFQVPRIDVSNSQRYPGAQPMPPPIHQDPNRSELLQPQYQARSQSVSSLSKGRGRARGLSVTFTDRPPAVIGEGGDQAEAPPIEISKAHQRARSVSPTPTPRTVGPIGRLWSRSPILRKPLPEKVVSPVKEEDDFFNPVVKRTQTGMSPSPALGSKNALDKEFEMSLSLGSASMNSPGSTISPDQPILHAPKPIHPPVAIPSVREPQSLKSTIGTKNLRAQYDRDKPSSKNTLSDPSESGPNRRFQKLAAQQHELKMREVADMRGRGGHPAHQRRKDEDSRNDDNDSWI
jgi:hypothetical protein